MCLLAKSGDLETLTVDKLTFYLFIKSVCAGGKVYINILPWLLRYFIHTHQVSQQKTFGSNYSTAAEFILKACMGECFCKPFEFRGFVWEKGAAGNEKLEHSPMAVSPVGKARCQRWVFPHVQLMVPLGKVDKTFFF